MMIRKVLGAYKPTIVKFKAPLLVAIVTHVSFFAIANFLRPLIITRIIGKLSEGGLAALEDFTVWIVLLAASEVVRAVVVHIGQLAWMPTKPGALRHLENRAYEHLLRRSMGFYGDNFVGSLVATFGRYSRAFIVLVIAFYAEFIPIIVQIVLPLVYMLLVAPEIGVAYGVASVGIITVLTWAHVRKIPYSQEVARQESRRTGRLADTLTNILPVKTLARQRYEKSAFDGLLFERGQAIYENDVKNHVIRLAKQVTWSVLRILLVYVIVRMVLSGSLNVADGLVILYFSQELLSALWNAGKVVEKVEQAVADASEMIEIFEEPVQVVDPHNPQSFDPGTGKIVFDDVHFTYEAEGSGPIFSSLDFAIKPRQKIGLVGPSGGGKSTFVKLLLRFTDIQSGSISINGQNIADVRQNDVRQAIAYVPQEPVLFHRTIQENIAYGATDATDNEIARVVKLAHVAEFIDDLPEGLDTMVGERGVKLSGGQRQRIAIARAMLQSAPILVLDEATSALDSESEKLIIDALDSLMKGRTTIVIAHRLSTIKKLDRIAVLDKGTVAEDGTHQQLLKKKGIYHKLWSHQTGDFIDD